MKGWTLLALLVAGCGAGTPSGPSPGGGPPASIPPSAPFTIDLPIARGDSRYVAYGIWPFGVHGGGHAEDGHPGLDFEYQPGASVLAAADGTVDNRIPDPVPGRISLQLRHTRAVGAYFTNYSNLEQVPPGLTPGASVSRGQAIGIAGSLPAGGAPQFAMTHFGMADPTYREPGTGLAIASPVNYFTAEARVRLDEIWRQSSYRAEWCEPFLTNDRASGFPMSRTWTLASGQASARIVVRCPSDVSDPEYTLIGPDGSTTETGTLVVNYFARPQTTAEFRPSRGATRRAVYDIVSETLRLAIGAAGGPPPASLADASTYTTR
jgi:hypothetical protein